MAHFRGGGMTHSKGGGGMAHLKGGGHGPFEGRGTAHSRGGGMAHLKSGGQDGSSDIHVCDWVKHHRNHIMHL